MIIVSLLVSSVTVAGILPGSAGGLAGDPVGAQFPAGQRALVHLVGAVGEAEGPGVRPQVREREILADPGRAVRRDRPVDHPLGHGPSDDLYGLDLAVRGL